MSITCWEGNMSNQYEEEDRLMLNQFDTEQSISTKMVNTILNGSVMEKDENKRYRDQDFESSTYRHWINAQEMLDSFYIEQKKIEKEVNAVSREIAFLDGHYRRIEETVHRQTIEFTDFYNRCKDKQELLNTLKSHPFHSEIIMQSKIAQHALDKPYGYAGDKDLMIKICDFTDEGETNYAILHNRVYLNLPSADGVRIRKQSLKNTISRLNPGSNVFNLACGPALEIQEYLKENPDTAHTFYLVDHDPETVDYLASKNLGERVQLINGNAFKLSGKKIAKLCNNQKFDLAYSSGLFDYVNQKFAPRIANAMFENVKSGGRLLIGNYLVMGENNPHKEHHKNMMELYSEWFLIYRTPEEIMDFTSKMDKNKIARIELKDEYFGLDKPGPSTIGFLIVEKK